VSRDAAAITRRPGSDTKPARVAVVQLTEEMIMNWKPRSVIVALVGLSCLPASSGRLCSVAYTVANPKVRSWYAS
jgi:uncharacterized membrane protein YdjX (TVP38/TMEM64 family)